MTNENTFAPMMIRWPSGQAHIIDVSFSGGPESEADRTMHALLTDFAAGDLHTISLIGECQVFLSNAGYGLSNVIVVEVLPLEQRHHHSSGDPDPGKPGEQKATGQIGKVKLYF